MAVEPLAADETAQLLALPARLHVATPAVPAPAGEAFSLTEAQENELLAAMSEIDRGDYESLDQLVSSLPMCR